MGNVFSHARADLICQRKTPSAGGFRTTRHSMRKTERRIARNELLVAAAQVGLVRPAISEIARAAGVSDRTVQHIFARDRRGIVSDEAEGAVLEVLGLSKDTAAKS